MGGGGGGGGGGAGGGFGGEGVGAAPGGGGGGGAGGGFSGEGVGAAPGFGGFGGFGGFSGEGIGQGLGGALGSLAGGPLAGALGSALGGMIGGSFGSGSGFGGFGGFGGEGSGSGFGGLGGPGGSGPGFGGSGPWFGGSGSGFGGSGGGQSPVPIGSIADQIFALTSKLRGNFVGSLEDFSSGDFDFASHPMFDSEKSAIEDQFANARDNILGNIPEGGSLIDSLSNLETGKAKSLTDVISNIQQDMFNKTQQAAFGMVPSSISAQTSTNNRNSLLNANKQAQEDAQDNANMMGAGVFLSSILSDK